MRTAVRVAVVFLVGALASHAAYAQKVTTQSDPKVDLMALKTFAIREGVMRSPNTLLNNDLMKKRIESDITQALMAKGLAVTSANPDLSVAYIFGSLAGRRLTATGQGRGNGIEGNLVIDLRNASGALLWHGVATVEEQNASKVADKVDDMVKKVFGKYPK